MVHLRKGAPDVPVWLFSKVPPLPETAALCERVEVRRSSLLLLLRAELQLWPRWVAISVGTWTGQRGKWPLKLAPFLIPPFRALVLNENADFFAATPVAILQHWTRRLRDAVHSRWCRVKDVGIGLGQLGLAFLRRIPFYALFVLTALLRLLSFPHRRVFQWLHGTGALAVRSKAAAGAGLVRFRQNKPQWDAAELERFARASDARWIVWQRGSVGEPREDAFQLFDDERTFAVTKQSHVRGWEPMLLPLAPFRTLQPGEASQVLAPLSGSILVDREKLLALGIPRCSLAETAWMLLFWKAAAAGWRCYSLGQSAPLKEQPDLPMQNTDFLLRVLWEAALRHLGPREPDLSRGNIAFRAAHRLRAISGGERPRVLLVSPFVPYPLSHGGAVRIYNLCRALADRVDFSLVARREQHDVIHYEKLEEIFREVHVVDFDEPTLRDERLPEQVRRHQSRALRALIGELARRWKPDLLQIEYTHMAAFRDAAPGVPAILVEHDLTFSLYRQLARNDPGARPGYERWLEFERRWLEAYDGVWAVSEDDRQAAIREGRREADRTFTIANGVDIGRFTPGEEPTPAPEILYVGSFRHLPNILGFEKLRDQLMSRVWSRHPEVRLRVVAGPQHEQFWYKLGRKSSLAGLDPRIEVLGFVEDMRPLYARATVVVVPLEVSAGTNIKVLEAMACGKAVVTTPVGCAGLGLLDGQEVLIREDWPEFAEAVCDLVSDAALRSRMAARARRTAEERFSWTAIAQDAYLSYQMLITSNLESSRSRP